MPGAGRCGCAAAPPRRRAVLQAGLSRTGPVGVPVRRRCARMPLNGFVPVCISGFISCLVVDMSLVYRKVDAVLSANTSGEVREGDRLLMETGRMPREGELALVRAGKIEGLCRWHRESGSEVIGVVIGIKRRL